MKLHLGCGNKFIKGYVHIDAIDFPHVDHVSAIDNLSFIEENSVELIYACHVLEHFKRRDVSKVLKEWNRVLTPGGILRLAVPNFEKICEVYTVSKNLDLVIGPLFGGQNYLYNIHYNIFDLKSINEYLSKSGFKDIREYDWRKTDHSDVDDYSQAYIPHMDKENGTLISLNVECKK